MVIRSWPAPGFLILATLLLPGCFGSCGGCSDEGLGAKLFDKLQAVDEASGGALSEPREGDAAAGEGGGGTVGAGLRSWIDDPRLARMTGKLLDERFRAKGFAGIACGQEASDDVMATLVACRYSRGDRVVAVDLTEYRDRDLFLDEVKSLVFDPGVRVVAGGRVLSLQVTDKKASQNLLSALFGAGGVPSAQAAKAALEAQGFQVHDCLREEEEGLAELECGFEQAGALEGEYQVELLDDAADPDPEQWRGELFVGTARGRAEASLLLLDLKAARDLMRELFPELRTQKDKLLVLVSLEQEKHDGKNWDAGFGLPDPFIQVNGVSYRQQRCRDTLDCTFVVPAADVLEVAVFDADAAADDSAGETRCGPDLTCETRDAVVRVTSVW